MASVFNALNNYYFSGDHMLLLDLLHDKIKSESEEIFAKTFDDHDNFFGGFTPIWMNLLQVRRYDEAEKIWDFALSFAEEWETKNSRVHKGTPYYFLGVTQILSGKIDEGFLSMHQALEEDRMTKGAAFVRAPAYCFVTLNFLEINQFFRTKVVEISDYLEERIQQYGDSRGGILTLKDFRNRFLTNPDRTEEVFTFVHFLFRINRILAIKKKLRNNKFSSLYMSHILFDLALTTEKIIENKHPDKSTRQLQHSDELTFLRTQRYLTHTQADFERVHGDFKNDIGGTLLDMLNESYTSGIDRIDEDCLISYELRNYATHKIEIAEISRDGKDIVVIPEYIETIVQRLLNAFFYYVEKLYS